MTAVRVSCWVLGVCLLAANATAQQRGVAQPLMAVVVSNAPIYIEARVLQTPLRTAAVGTRLEVLEEGPEWTRVRFGDPQFGPRIGFVETKHLRIERPELQPMDLSVSPTASAPSPPQTQAPRPQPTAQPAPASLESPVNRRGFLIGLGLGGGIVACNPDCDVRGAFIGEFHIGGMVGDRTALMYAEDGSLFTDDFDRAYSFGAGTLSVQQWVSPRSWIKVGGGFGVLTCFDCLYDAEFGPAFSFSSGGELVQKRSFVLDLQGRFTYGHFSDPLIGGAHLFKSAVLLGFNWY